MLGAAPAARLRRGRQPDGTVIMDDGTVWNPQTDLPPLPPEVAAVAARVGLGNTPIGNPLSPAPTGFAGQPLPRGSMPPNTMSLAGDGGMMGSRGAPAMRAPLGIDTSPAPPAPALIAMANNVGGAPDSILPSLPAPIKPHFFDQGGLGSKLLAGVGTFANTYLANQGAPGSASILAAQLRQPDQRRDEAFRRDQFDWQKRKDMRPEIRGAGRSVLSVPFEGEPKVLYTAPTDAESYAAAIGAQPGTPEYETALQDFALRGNGPTAYGYHLNLEGVRQGNREDLEDRRFGNRLTLRGTPTYGNLHPRPASAGRSGAGGGNPTMAGVIAPILAKLSRGEPLTPAEQQAMAYYRPPSRARGGGLGGGGGIPMIPPPQRSAGPGSANPAPTSQPVRVSSPAEAQRLPSGTRFVGPDGQVRVRK